MNTPPNNRKRGRSPDRNSPNRNSPRNPPDLRVRRENLPRIVTPTSSTPVQNSNTNNSLGLGNIGNIRINLPENLIRVMPPPPPSTSSTNSRNSSGRNSRNSNSSPGTLFRRLMRNKGNNVSP